MKEHFPRHIPTFQGGDIHRNDYLPQVPLSFYRAQVLGVIGSRGTSAFSLPFLLISAIFSIILLAYPEYSVLYTWQPWLVRVHTYPGCFDQFGVLGHITSWLILLWIPMMSSMGSVGANLNLPNQSCWVPGSFPLITHFNTLSALTSSHFGHMPFHRKLIARLKLHGFSLLNHYHPKKYLLSA